MTDIVTRLLKWTHAVDAAPASDLMEQAAEEIIRLRSLAQSHTSTDCSGPCVRREAYEGDIVNRLRNWRGLHLAHGGDLFEEAADTISNMRLTNDEHEALSVAVEYVGSAYQVEHLAVILKNLMHKLQNHSVQ